MANENQKNGQSQDLNQILKLRREKFKELQEMGKDPFVITKYDVTHHSTDILDHFESLEGQTVRIAGRMIPLCMFRINPVRFSAM